MGFLLGRCKDVTVFILYLMMYCKYTSCDEITAQATCTGTMIMYADGKEVGRHTDKNTAGKFHIPANTKIVGIYCLADMKQNKVAGIIAQFDMIDVGDYFTDATWKCSKTFSGEWMDLDYDDSAWAYAEALKYNNFPVKMKVDQSVFEPISGIMNHTQYIWTEKYGLPHGDPAVYCRGHIGFEYYYTNYGRRFALAFMDNLVWSWRHDINNGNHLHIFTYKSTWVTVVCFTPLLRSEKNYWYTISRINVKYSNIVDLPRSLRHVGAIKQGKTGVICVATAPISIIGLNQEIQRSDNFLSLPLEQFGGENEAMEYYALNWDGVDGGKDVRMLIMAVYDQTIIEVHPTTTISGDSANKVPKMGSTFNITLKRYATYQFAGTHINLSGTRVLSNRPIIVYSGNKDTAVYLKGSRSKARDHLVEQLMPVKHWGKKFILAPIAHGTMYRKVRSSSTQLTFYKIIAANDKTEITIKFFRGFVALLAKTTKKTLNAGSYYQWGHVHGELAYVTATSGIMVSQFTASEDVLACVGGAWQMMVPPVELYHNFYQVFLTGYYKEPRRKDCDERMILTIIVPMKEENLLIINDKYIPNLDKKVFKKVDQSAIKDTGHTYMHLHCVFQGLKSIIVRHAKPYINFGVYFNGYSYYDAFSTAAGVRLFPINNKPCVKGRGVRGDGLDNDCDGSIDNSHCKWPDPDADCSALKPADGNWGSWVSFGACKCGFNGGIPSTRKCDNPAPSDRGKDCEGRSFKSVPCTCERKDGAWSDWLPWSQCTGSCLEGADRSGKRIRTRTCSKPFPSNGGNDCPGENNEQEACSIACLADLMKEFKACKLDLVILMDRSLSIALDNWKEMKEFIKLFITAFTISEDRAQIAMVSFSTELTVEFSFGTDIDSMKKKIDEMPDPSGRTATAMAMNKVHEIIKDGRKEADKVVLLLTDGEPTQMLDGTGIKRVPGVFVTNHREIKDEAIKVAAKLRPELEALLVIGVTKGVSKQFLFQVAGKRSNYIHFEDFKDLTKNLLLILTATCSLGKTGFLPKFIEEPQNVAAVQGSSIKLQCTAPNAQSSRKHDQVWQDLRNPKKPVVMSSNWNIDQAYKNKLVLDGMYHLKIDNTTMDFAGKYCCHDKLEEDENKRCAEVIMLESKPVFRSGIPDDILVKEGYHVNYSCEVRYRGRWGPMITWTDSDGESVSHEDMSTTAFAKTVVKFDATRRENNQEFTCIVHFGNILVPPPGDGEATNAPTYAYKMKSAALTVYYPPQLTRIVDDTGRPVGDIEKVSVGDVVICQTESNPIEEDLYHWYTDTEDLLGTTPDITVTEDFVNAFTITCIVENTLGKDSAEISKSEVLKSVSNVGSIAGISMGVVAAILLVAGALVLLWHLRNKRRDNYSVSDYPQDDFSYRESGKW